MSIVDIINKFISRSLSKPWSGEHTRLIAYSLMLNRYSDGIDQTDFDDRWYWRRLASDYAETNIKKVFSQFKKEIPPAALEETIEHWHRVNFDYFCEVVTNGTEEEKKDAQYTVGTLIILENVRDRCEKIDQEYRAELGREVLLAGNYQQAQRLGKLNDKLRRWREQVKPSGVVVSYDFNTRQGK